MASEDVGVKKEKKKLFHRASKCCKPDEEKKMTRVGCLDMLRRADHIAWHTLSPLYLHNALVLCVDKPRSRIQIINYTNIGLHPIFVQIEWLQVDLDKMDIYRVEYKKEECYPPEVVIQRAMSRLGEREYNLVTNNCEHFARWAKTGESRSFQVDTLKHYLGMKAGPPEMVRDARTPYTFYHVHTNVPQTSVQGGSTCTVVGNRCQSKSEIVQHVDDRGCNPSQHSYIITRPQATTVIPTKLYYVPNGQR